jgi:metal-responsive CopG/Arc/MetJ family transcriptional regulator
MKTAISIPDDLFDDAERLARVLKKSRSRLYGDAVREYVARHSADQITEAMDQALEAMTSSDSDFATSAARRALERSDW